MELLYPGNEGNMRGKLSTSMMHMKETADQYYLRIKRTQQDCGIQNTMEDILSEDTVADGADDQDGENCDIVKFKSNNSQICSLKISLERHMERHTDRQRNFISLQLYCLVCKVRLLFY